ncbi:MAG: hypothetical protein JKY52_07600 [Flavobacteriales bacterium]|nr:hypothetical protein [Flavobacteriales bacterium]
MCKIAEASGMVIHLLTRALKEVNSIRETIQVNDKNTKPDLGADVTGFLDTLGHLALI